MPSESFVLTDSQGHATTVSADFTVSTPSGTSMGMNFAPASAAAANAPYEPKADSARIYVSDGQTDITKQAEFKRAYNLGVRTYMLSTKDANPPTWYGTVPKDCKWYGVAHHEPFPEMTPAQFVALQVLHMPKVRAAGGIPTMVLQAWDLDPSKPHGDMAGSIPPKGTVDVIGFDYYPAPSSPTQATVLARMKAYLASAGVTRLAIGEYGVPQATTSASVALINAWKSLTKDVEINLYWSQTKSPNEYHFSDATAAAWFA